MKVKMSDYFAATALWDKLASSFAAIALCLVLTGTASANLIVNGGFETGDFTGWTLSGNTGFTFVNGNNVHSGNFSAALGPLTQGNLEQTVATTAGEFYTIDFWLASDIGGAAPRDFHAFWDGSEIYTESDTLHGYQSHSFNLLASGAATTLRFEYTDIPGFYRLDDVSVNAVPEPASLALLGLGALSLAANRWRSKNPAA